MADLNTTIGLSDREFKRGLQSVRRDVQRTRGTIERESGGIQRSIGGAARGLAAAYITIEQLNRGFRAAGEATAAYRRQNTYLDESLRDLESIGRDVQTSFGRDMALSLSTSVSLIDRLGRGVERIRAGAVNVGSDIFTLTPGHGRDVTDAMRRMEELDRARTRAESSARRLGPYDEETMALSGDEYGAQRARLARELRERQIDINNREREARKTDPGVSFDDERDAADRLFAARSADLDRRRAARLGGYRDTFDSMRAEAADRAGDTSEADSIRKQMEIRKLAESINRDGLLTEQERNDLIAEGTRLIEERYRRMREQDSRGVEAGRSAIAGQVFGRREPTRHEALVRDARGRRLHDRMARRASMLDRVGGTDTRRYDLADAATRYSRESIDAVYRGRLAGESRLAAQPVLSSAVQTPPASTARPSEIRSRDLEEIKSTLSRMAEHVAKGLGGI